MSDFIKPKCGMFWGIFRGMMGGGVPSAGDTTPPTISTIVVNTGGTTITVTCDENVVPGTDAGWAFTSSSGGSITVTYASGTGTTALVYNVTRGAVSGAVIYSNETVNYVYTTGAGRVADTTGNLLASIGSTATTNSSTQTAPTVMFADGNGFESPWAPVTNTGNWDWFFGTPVSSATAAKGSVSQSNTAQGNYCGKNVTTRTEVWFDFWIRKTATGHNTFANLYSAAYASIYVQVTDGAKIILNDDTTQWTTDVTASVNTWYHIFGHIKFVAGTGTETVQVYAGTGDKIGAWQYSSAVQSIVPADVTQILVGCLVITSGGTQYVDAFNSWYGTTMPSEWF